MGSYDGVIDADKQLQNGYMVVSRVRHDFGDFLVPFA